MLCISHKLIGGWPCYGGVVDVLGRLISVFSAASTTIGQASSRRSNHKQTNKHMCLYLGRGRSDLQSVKIFLGTILRLAYQSPFNDIATGMSELLKNLEDIGLQIPRIRFKNGPSLYIPQSEVPKLSDTTSEAYEIFKDAFMNDARVSHMVQVMGFHPSYTVEWVRAHHYLLRGNGVLPRHIRAYVAILASARHNCLYTVNLFEREFLCFGGNPDWLNGVDRAPLKYQRLNKVNNILCHKAWSLTHTDIELDCVSGANRSEDQSTEVESSYFSPARVKAEGLHPDAFCKKV
eukprot:sb/3467615/